MRTRLFLHAVQLFLLTLLTYFIALTVNGAIAAWIALPPSALITEELLLSLPQRTIQPLSAYAVIHTRDIFHSEKLAAGANNVTVASTGRTTFKLWGTAVREGERAFAILENQTTHVQGLYREGEQLSLGVTLVQVGWDRVILDREGRHETLLLPRDSTPAASSTQSQPLVVRGTAPLPDEGKDGIRQVAQDTFQIDRREVEHAIAHLSDLFTQVRAVPFSGQDGVSQGFRLFAIKPESLIDRIGIKNGDIVQRVNGVEMSDPATAFSLLQDLQGNAQIRVDVLRNHQPVTLSYEIR